jgi:hypothetical protein
MKVGVCPVCQQQGVSVSPRTSNPDEEVCEDWELLIHEAYGEICDGTGDVPEEVYEK